MPVIKMTCDTCAHSSMHDVVHWLLGCSAHQKLVTAGCTCDEWKLKDKLKGKEEQKSGDSNKDTCD